jgi:hypothetical protein
MEHDDARVTYEWKPERRFTSKKAFAADPWPEGRL